MRIQMKGQITINAAADKVWRVLAHNFDDIGRWATVISASKAATDMPAPEGAAVGGRVCSAPGFGEVQEKFTYYDEPARRFGYKGIEGLPSFIKAAENNWSVHALGANKCLVESRAEVDFKLIPGLLMIPIFKFQMGRTGAKLLEELKYYVEHDHPHPRKLKAQQQQLQQAAPPS